MIDYNNGTENKDTYQSVRLGKKFYNMGSKCSRYKTVFLILQSCSGKLS